MQLLPQKVWRRLLCSLCWVLKDIAFPSSACGVLHTVSGVGDQAVEMSCAPSPLLLYSPCPGVSCPQADFWAVPHPCHLGSSVPPPAYPPEKLFYQEKPLGSPWANHPSPFIARKRNPIRNPINAAFHRVQLRAALCPSGAPRALPCHQRGQEGTGGDSPFPRQPLGAASEGLKVFGVCGGGHGAVHPGTARLGSALPAPLPAPRTWSRTHPAASSSVRGTGEGFWGG